MSAKKSTTVTLQRYYKVTKTSPEPLRPENIQVSVSQGSFTSPTAENRPNFIALALLWAHYQAYQLGILAEDLPSPWEIVDTLGSLQDESNPWIRFLKTVITDKSWVDWIQDPTEVRHRTLEAFALTQGPEFADTQSPEYDDDDNEIDPVFEREE